MAESDILPEEIKAQIDQIGHTDLVLCLPAAHELEAAVAKTQQALLMFPPDFKAVLVHTGGESTKSRQTTEPAPPDCRLLLLAFPQLSAWDSRGRSLFEDRHLLFAISRKLTARVCTVMETDVHNIAADNLFRLIQPVVGRDQDLVVAAYQRRRFEGLINTAIVYPLLRSLYGKQVLWPLARDFSLSPRLMDRCLARISASDGRAEEVSPAWIVTEALSGDFQVSQTHLQTRPEAAQTDEDLSTILSHLLSPLLLEMERDAPFWQKLRGSQRIPTFGEPGAVSEEPHPVDVGRMIESFGHGFRNLREIWNLVLSPATIIGMKKLTMLAPERFHMPDELWARIVYDFALAFHARTINRDHLLRALTPAYLAWVASWALEVQDSGEARVAAKIERLCSVYEGEKPYFLSRWRWPDRFNP